MRAAERLRRIQKRHRRGMNESARRCRRGMRTHGRCARQRQFDGEARADARALNVGAVLGPDAAAMARNDLARDRKPQARILAEAVLDGALGIEAVEDAFEIVVRNARPVILDDGAHDAAVRLARRRAPVRRRG